MRFEQSTRRGGRLPRNRCDRRKYLEEITKFGKERSPGNINDRQDGPYQERVEKGRPSQGKSRGILSPEEGSEIDFIEGCEGILEIVSKSIGTSSSGKIVFCNKVRK